MATLSEVRVPRIGEFSDVPVIEILVSVGERIAVEDPIVTLESDKATMDVPAPVAGVVKELLVEIGSTVSEGTLLLRVETDADGEGEPQGGEAPPPETEAQGGEEAPRAEVEGPGGGESSAVYAGPGARRRARELGVDLAAVEGSGRKGRIVAGDIEAVVARGSEPTAAPEAEAPGEPKPGEPEPVAESSGRAESSREPVELSSLGLPPWPVVDHAAFGPIERVPLSRIRRKAGPYLHRNWLMIPHVTHNDEADITELESFRARTNREQTDGVKVTMVALLLKASAAALRDFPDLNSSLEGEEVVRKRYYHLGVATDTPGGLLVPVIRDVDCKGLLDVARELATLAESARAGTLTPSQMQGASFTISSLGGVGGTTFTPIINAPEVAILGVTRAAMKPVWDGSAFEPRLMLPLSLSYDHRVVDGATAARFVVHLGALLADVRRVIL